MPRAALRTVLPVISLFLHVLSTIRPTLDNQSRIKEFFQLIVLYLMLLTSLARPPLFGNLLPIMQRLDPDFHGFEFRGRDVFTTIENQRYLFWLNTGELPETLNDITRRISPELSRLNWRGGVRRRRRSGKLNNTNKVLLTFLWLRKYPCIDTLALLFDVSRATVSCVIYSVVPILWRFFSNEVVWPSIAEWNVMRGKWRTFPDAVGCIDGTPHEIYRPKVEPQAQFYSGHRHYHLMNTQLVVDNCGNIVFLQAGFLGSMNDAGNYILMQRIGPGTHFDMPPRVVLLADKGYGDIVPLLTPFRAAQIRRMPRPDQRRARQFNRKLSKCRIIVEHTFKYVKTYQAVGSLWRHPRWFQPTVVELCTFLAQRHVVLFDSV